MTKPKRSRIDPEKLEWAKRLLEDGMPYVITAETVGLHRETLAKALPGYDNYDAWKDVWAGILGDKRLFRLHISFNEYESTATAPDRSRKALL